ncbi:MAG TPA: hypothetical protein VEC37_09865 [Bacillota bacterium]|nr:hypothetical protein [Bacillota bacterium]
MFENEVLKLHREVGAIKQDLLTGIPQGDMEDHEKFSLATKIDLTVSRLMRLIDKVEVTTP